MKCINRSMQMMTRLEMRQTAKLTDDTVNILTR